MKSPHSVSRFLVPAASLLVVLTLLSGCASQQTTADATPTQPGGDDASRSAVPSDEGTDAQAMDSDAADTAGKVVYFDYDRDNIKSEYRELIAAHAQFLRDHPQARVELGGHADERGSREYNLALSERRAKAVLNQLLVSGVRESQLNATAYGEEYPAVDGHNEAAWSKNRRVEIKYQEGAPRAARP